MPELAHVPVQVPMDMPAPALDMLTHFLRNESFPGATLLALPKLEDSHRAAQAASLA